MADPARHGLAIRRTQQGWALFKYDRLLYECNLRERVESALRDELEELEAGAYLRRLLAPPRPPRGRRPSPHPQRPRPKPVPRPMAEQRESAGHEAAHAAAAWAMGYPVNEIWIHRAGPKIRENGGVKSGFIISRWSARSDQDRADSAVIRLAGPVFEARQAGASLDDLLWEPDSLKRFGGSRDIPEARRKLSCIGPDVRRELTGEWYPSNDELLRTLIYRTSRWSIQPTMRRMIEALAGELLDEDGNGRMTSKGIDRVLQNVVPSWSLSGGRSRW
jgi:hypothetical protein